MKKLKPETVAYVDELFAEVLVFFGWSEEKRVMKRVLISSYSFAPDHGSESELGWRFVESLKDHCEVVVFVWKEYAQFFSKEDLKRLAAEGVSVEFAGFEGWFGELMRRPFFERAHYLLWQKRLPKWVGERYQVDDFDLVHHVSWATYSTASRLWKLGRPFVVGPVGGGEVAPFGLLKGLGLKAKAYEWVRAVRIGVKRFDWELAKSLKSAHLVWAANPETAERCRLVAPDCHLELRTQVVLEELPNKRIEPDSFVVVTVARLIPLKRTELLVEAFLKAKGVKGELRVIGDGPELEPLKALVGEEGSDGKKVTFCGWKSREEVAAELKAATLFAFASLHDSASFAVLEAMGNGLPVVCLKTGGPAFLAGDGGGVVIDARTREDAVKGFRDAFEDLYSNRERREQLSSGAYLLAGKLTREESMRVVLVKYREVLDGESANLMASETES